jgi:hypothetical protein
MSEWIIKTWKKEWPKVKDSPYSFAVVLVSGFVIGILLMYFLYSIFVLPGKDSQIGSLQQQKDLCQTQKDELLKEKDKLASQIAELPKQVFATSEALMSPILQNMTIRICDLAREDFVIHNKTFENCHIYGPAIIACDNVIMTHTTITAAVPPDPNSFVIETTNQFCLGVIVFKDCTFKHCTLYKIGFIGTHEQIADIKKQIPLIAEIKE